ncbi:MAG: diguanylate cyclase [Lysobacteraceae bacterium]
MALDLMTLMLVSTVLCFITALLMAYVRSGYPARYRLLLRVWAEALVLQGLGWLAFVLRGTVPDVVSVIFANVLLLAGMQRINHAFHLYFERPIPWPREAGLMAAAVLFLTVFQWGWHDVTTRIVGMTLALSWPLVHGLALMRRYARRPWPPSFRVVAVFLVLTVAVLFVRAVNQVFGTPVDSIIAVHPTQIALHLLATLAPVATALGFALMVATRLQDELAEAANTDPLTGLANRRRVEALARPWIDDPDAPLCALMIDVDHFKRVNDRFGHDAGDEALVWLGSHLRVQARATDLVGRLGGEEFVMLLPGTTATEAAVRAERLRATVAAMPMSFAAHGDWPLTISVGVASRTPGDTDVRDLLRRADDAMYAAKRGGRNRVVLAD